MWGWEKRIKELWVLSNWKAHFDINSDGEDCSNSKRQGRELEYVSFAVSSRDWK